MEDELDWIRNTRIPFNDVIFHSDKDMEMDARFKVIELIEKNNPDVRWVSRNKPTEFVPKTSECHGFLIEGNILRYCNRSIAEELLNSLTNIHIIHIDDLIPHRD